MKCATIFAVCTVIFYVNGQNAAAKPAEPDAVQAQAAAEEVPAATQADEVKPEPSEAPGETKDFPPYNYTPTENSNDVDYDLDATTVEPTTVPANTTEGGLTFKEMSERMKRKAFMCNVYQVTTAFSWLTVLASVLTLLFKIHEYYLH